MGTSYDNSRDPGVLPRVTSAGSMVTNRKLSCEPVIKPMRKAILSRIYVSGREQFVKV